MVSSCLLGLSRPVQRGALRSCKLSSGSALTRASVNLWRSIALLWQIELPTDVLPALSICAAGSRTCVLNQATGSLTCWEEAGAVEPYVPSDLGPLLAVAAGTGHTCTLTVLGKAGVLRSK